MQQNISDITDQLLLFITCDLTRLAVEVSMNVSLIKQPSHDFRCWTVLKLELYTMGWKAIGIRFTILNVYVCLCPKLLEYAK
jgi:hypothetical protein